MNCTYSGTRMFVFYNNDKYDRNEYCETYFNFCFLFVSQGVLNIHRKLWNVIFSSKKIRAMKSYENRN